MLPLIAGVVYLATCLAITQWIQTENALFTPRPNSKLEKCALKFGPFRRTDPVLTMSEILKTALLAWTLLPLRIVWALLCVTVYWIVVKLALLGHGKLDTCTPIPESRRKFIRLGRYFARICLFGFGFYKIERRGTPTKPAVGKDGTPAVVMVSNHMSYLDILVHMAHSMPSFIAKADVRNIPMVGLCAQAMQCAFTEREAAKRAGVSDLVVQRQNANAADFPPLCIYPEGTTTNGDFLVRFSTGAFRAGKPVQVLCLRYPYQKFCPAWESMDIHLHLFRMLTQVRNYVEVTFLPVYTPSEEERKEPQLYASNVRLVMADHLGQPVTEHVYRHKVAFLKLLAGKISVEEAEAALVAAPEDSRHDSSKHDASAHGKSS
eukprot:tig00000821_g4511.t1